MAICSFLADMAVPGGAGGGCKGRQQWIFNLIPRPGEEGHDTWPTDAYKAETGLMPWSGQSLDEKRGIVYVATKTAEPNFLAAAVTG